MILYSIIHYHIFKCRSNHRICPVFSITIGRSSKQKAKTKFALRMGQRSWGRGFITVPDNPTCFCPEQRKTMWRWYRSPQTYRFQTGMRTLWVIGGPCGLFMGKKTEECSRQIVFNTSTVLKFWKVIAWYLQGEPTLTPLPVFVIV